MPPRSSCAEIEESLLCPGCAGLLFGLVLMARPGVGALAVVWMIGLYAILFGGLLVALGFRVRTLAGLVRQRL
jgi:uncharacterized membrane protein HdeD (DUF308 family)